MAFTRLVQKTQDARLKVWALLVGIFLAILLGIWGAHLLHRYINADFPFRYVRIIMNAKHLSPMQIERIVKANLQGGFFSLRAQALRTVLLQEPWIHDVAFRRLWPDTLEVDVIEQAPVARWGYTQLINAAGEIFTPSVDTIPLDLPLLLGPADAPLVMLHEYQQFQDWLTPLGLSIAELSWKPNHGYLVVLNNHLQITLGEAHVSNHMQQFVLLYQKVVKTNTKKALTVDLRYANGAAIQWQEK